MRRSLWQNTEIARLLHPVAEVEAMVAVLVAQAALAGVSPAPAAGAMGMPSGGEPADPWLTQPEAVTDYSRRHAAFLCSWSTRDNGSQER